MNSFKRFLLRRLVYLAWLVTVVKRSLRIAAGEAEAALCRPFEGLPTGIEMLDGSQRDRDSMRRVVVWLRNPVRLLVGGIVRTPSGRRTWLVRKILALPRGRDISYVLHYWDHLGVKQSILTRDPRRGLKPPAPKKRPGPCMSQVMAAYHGDEDVTPDIKRVSASFHEAEGEVCPVALDAYLRHRRGLSLRSHPIVVTDATLRERQIELTVSKTNPTRSETPTSRGQICSC